MAADPASRVPRWLRVASYPVAALLLTAFFVFLGFPYNLLAMRLGDAVGSSLDVRLRIGELSPHLGLLGPGLAAREVVAGREGARAFEIEELVLRPAWSLAWFRGTPAVHLDLTSEVGSAFGTVTLGDNGGWQGRLEAVRLSYLPLEMLAAIDLDGLLDADVDLHAAGEEAGGGLLGTVDFDVREGSLSTDSLPIALPFDRLHGELLFGDDSYLKLSGVELEGPLVGASIEGRVGKAPDPARQPLSIDVAYQVHDASLAGMLGARGRPGPDGRTHLTVSGTLSKPVVR